MRSAVILNESHGLERQVNMQAEAGSLQQAKKQLEATSVSIDMPGSLIKKLTPIPQLAHLEVSLNGSSGCACFLCHLLPGCTLRRCLAAQRHGEKHP